MLPINIISIDPSIISTAININGEHFNYIKEKYALTKSGLSKWYKICEDIITYRYTNFIKHSNYSEGEIFKITDYDKITDLIISDIKSKIDYSKPIIIGIEGFSYSSSSGPLIDLVTFSTLLRYKLLTDITKNVIIFSPSTLKLLACKMTYEPIKKGKKFEYKNPEGISGGRFTKIEIYKSIIDNPNNKCEWTQLLREYESELLSMKSLKKPFDDINDAFNIYNIIKNNLHIIESESFDTFFKYLQSL